MANKTVTINVYSNGDFNYSLSLMGVSAGDIVTWNAGPDTGAFGITFHTDSPLTVGGPGYESGGSTNTIVGTVKPSVVVGTVYSYSVWAKHLPDNTKYTDGACPELIIR